MRINKMILFFAAYTFALLALAVVGYYALVDTPAKRIQAARENPHFHSDIAYVDLPRITLTLTAPQSGRSGIVRMDIALEVEQKYVPVIEGASPKITDRLVAYSAHINYDDVTRPNATTRLRLDLLHQVNNASDPYPVKDVVFRQFVVM